MADDGRPTLRDRTVSDVMSGMSVAPSYERYPNFSTDELDRQFAVFKEYDLEDTGFITKDNLVQILSALDVEVGAEQVDHMLAEVAILTNVPNDGKLSFRNYMDVIVYESKAKAHNDNVEAQRELRQSIAEAAEEAGIEPEAEEEEPEEEETLMRRSSFAVMESIAKSRISTFQQTVEAEQARASKSDAKVRSEMRFNNKLQKFKRIENPAENASIGNEKLHTAALKTKLAAFEAASKKKDAVVMTTTWKNVQPGNWKQRKSIAGGVAPRKSLADLP